MIIDLNQFINIVPTAIDELILAGFKLKPLIAIKVMKIENALIMMKEIISKVV